ncbi:MAG: hypothetical protein GTO14_12670 [Anaerolineales bacterium]|nr:hypothetical protein [Anaerolineales bacterium]
MKHRSLAGAVRVSLHMICLALSACTLLPTSRLTITGRVIAAGDQTPVPQSLVSLRASDFQTISEEDGSFTLRIPDQLGDFEITAWAPGYYIASEVIAEPQTDLTLTLRPHHRSDQAGYTWIDPTADSSENACGNCHPMILPQWGGNAHGQAISNRRFYSFYNGTDVSGRALDAPGYLKDFPGTSGNCATCHAPGVGVDAAFATEMDTIRGLVTAGIHCDFCHKVGGVYLDPGDDQVYANVPGVLSMQLLRPPEGEQIFIGPYPDIHDPDTYHPVFSQSAFCAPCHSFSFWGTEIYNSYGEWLASDYAAQGITCQACHMPPSGETTFALPEQGGLEHPPERIPSHFQLGVSDLDFMGSTVVLDVAHEVAAGTLRLEVELTNATAGHHVPTDHPGRHLILRVSALNVDGEPLPLKQGTSLPAWIGDLSGEPGEVFAKVLKNARTGAYPVVDYWNPTLIHSDTRIPANESHSSVYEFELGDEQVTIQIQVLFRRLFQPIAEKYLWDITDVILAEETITLQP